MLRASLAVLSLLLAHEGEEFVIALPAVMLGAAFFLMRWANKNDKDDDDADPPPEPQPELTGAEPPPTVATWGHS